MSFIYNKKNKNRFSWKDSLDTIQKHCGESSEFFIPLLIFSFQTHPWESIIIYRDTDNPNYTSTIKNEM